MSARPSPTPRVRSTRALDVFAIACAVVALVLLLLPASADMVPAASAREPDAPATAPAPTPVVIAKAHSDSLIAVVVNGNVFSASRRAPGTRFLAPGDRAAIAESPVSYGAVRPEAASDDSLPRLSGIVAIDGERRALLQLVAADESPKLYRVTESHAGYRIVQIGPDFVVLASRAGTRTLRLSRGAPPDSLEKLP